MKTRVIDVNWQYMKDAVGKSQTSVPVVLKIDGDLITDSLSIATRFNKYFTNIAETIIRDFETQSAYTPTPSFVQFLNNKLNGKPKFSFTYVNPDIIFAALNKLDCKKAVGIGNINSIILRMTSNSIVVALCHIINSSLDQGTSPPCGKLGRYLRCIKAGQKMILIIIDQSLFCQ